VNLLLYHAVLAPHARWRSQGVRYDRPAPDSIARQLEASLRAAGAADVFPPNTNLLEIAGRIRTVLEREERSDG